MSDTWKARVRRVSCDRIYRARVSASSVRRVRRVVLDEFSLTSARPRARVRELMPTPPARRELLAAAAARAELTSAPAENISYT